MKEECQHPVVCHVNRVMSYIASPPSAVVFFFLDARLSVSACLRMMYVCFTSFSLPHHHIITIIIIITTIIFRQVLLMVAVFLYV